MRFVASVQEVPQHVPHSSVWRCAICEMHASTSVLHDSRVSTSLPQSRKSPNMFYTVQSGDVLSVRCVLRRPCSRVSTSLHASVPEVPQHVYTVQARDARRDVSRDTVQRLRSTICERRAILRRRALRFAASGREVPQHDQIISRSVRNLRVAALTFAGPVSIWPVVLCVSDARLCDTKCRQTNLGNSKSDQSKTRSFQNSF